MSKTRKRKNKTDEVSPEIALLGDPVMQKAAVTLAYAGWNPDTIRKNGAVQAAARAAGVAVDSIYRWLKDEKFLAAIDAVKYEIIIECLANIRSIARSKNLTASIYLLKILDHERFDDQFLRQKAEREHETQMLKQRLAGLEEQVAQLPQIIYTEIAPVDRDESPQWNN